MAREIEEFMTKVINKNTGETEFHQAVREVIESVWPVIEKNPKYQSAKILERIVEPERVILFRVPWLDDKGEFQVNRGFRIEMNSAIGPYKGGLRLHPSVNLGILKFLAFEQVFKNSLTTLPMGGGKGGVIVNPKELSKGELERLSRAYAKAIAPVIGPNVDVPAPDVNTTPEIMSWIKDEYSKFVGKETPGVITGKPVEDGGSIGRDTATAQGAIYVFDVLCEEKGIKPEGTTIMIQGFGNAGSFMAKFLQEKGYAIKGVADSKGGLVATEGGLDMAKVAEIKAAKGSVINAQGEAGFEKTKVMKDAEFLVEQCDILVLAALENQVTGANAANVKAKYILELANGPVSPDGDEILEKNGVLVVPDVLTNSGGVTVSYFEWYQNVNNEKWTYEQVQEKLIKIMKKRLK